MQFEWDEQKNRENFAKHRVSFEAASLVFSDPLQVTNPDPCESEERWQTFGWAKGIVILMVVHTVEEKSGETRVRIISARKANRHEREAYEESHEKSR
jgi:uncharacterized protein